MITNKSISHYERYGTLTYRNEHDQIKKITGLLCQQARGDVWFREGYDDRFSVMICTADEALMFVEQELNK